MTHPPYDGPEYSESESPGPDWPPAPPREPREPREPDPLAVAVGNASLLGAGYLIMGRLGLFWGAAVVTVPLVWLVAAKAETWCELVLLLWWAVVVAHGWRLARRHPAAGPRRGQRVLALALALPVLVTAGWLRFDAHGIEDAVEEAREDGDCVAVVAAQERVGFGHRLAAAPVAARGDTVVEACERLDAAAGYLSGGLTGDLDMLKTGFGRLGTVLGEPGNERTVEATLKHFLGQLPTEDGCRTVRIADWLRDRESGPEDLSDPSSATAARIAPEALMECGDTLMTDEEWANARDRYRRLLDEHPADERAEAAREGVRKAGLAIELDNVQDLVTAADDMNTGYCRKPAKYSQAPTYRKGSNRALFVGDSEYTDKLPDGWHATDAAEAALVVCVDSAGMGNTVETCQYRDHDERIRSITFHQVEVRVKAYALRTGKLVTDRKLQISGSSCPYFISYYGSPPSRRSVTPTDADVRDAFGPVVKR
ncbi:tol-pal system YbgF family protein [Streptomyces sp. NPDC017454]|uniref:tol-pal system YbgF family protein n=1 Tax=Streptomyces sp. NPDC017454 TaxID=3364997 RepID=UPI0037B1DF4F